LGQVWPNCNSLGSARITTMPLAMKRPAARMSSSSVKREPVLKKPAGTSGPSGRVNQLCNQVSHAILESPEYPSEVKNMLANALIGSLAIPKEKRHSFQESAIEMVRKVLDSLEAAAQCKFDKVEKELETACKDNDARQCAVEAAAVTLAERTKTADAAKSEHAERTLARVAAKGALALAEQEQTTGNASLVATEEKKQRLESGMETIYSPLKNGELPAGEVPDGIKNIGKLGKELGLDASLLQTVPAALAKAPSNRGSFDNVVMSQLEAELQRCLVALTDELASGEPAKKERAAKVEAATIEHAEAVTAEEAAKAAKEALRTGVKDAETEHQALMKTQQQAARDMAAASAKVDTAKGELKEINEGPLAAFKELFDLTEIPPPAPAPEEQPEPTPAADAANSLQAASAATAAAATAAADDVAAGAVS